MQRIPEEDHDVDLALGDTGAELLIAAHGAAHEALDLEIGMLSDQRGGGTGPEQDVTGEGLLMPAHPGQQ